MMTFILTSFSSLEVNNNNGDNNSSVVKNVEFTTNITRESLGISMCENILKTPKCRRMSQEQDVTYTNSSIQLEYNFATPKSLQRQVSNSS